MDNLIRNIAIFLISGAISASPSIRAATVPVLGIGGNFSVPVKSRQEMRWDTVVKQQYDYSCGSAAIATLLTHHYDMPTEEATVFQTMFTHGDQAKIRAEGFSLYDMKLYLDSRGLQADGFRITLDKLEKIGITGIALVNTQGYKHFVVVKAIRGDQVIVGDPAVGSTVVPRKFFETIWNGSLLAARVKADVARLHFNSPEDWKIQPRAPVAQALDRSGLGMLTLSLPRSNEF